MFFEFTSLPLRMCGNESPRSPFRYCYLIEHMRINRVREHFVVLCDAFAGSKDLVLLVDRVQYHDLYRLGWRISCIIRRLYRRSCRLWASLVCFGHLRNRWNLTRNCIIITSISLVDLLVGTTCHRTVCSMVRIPGLRDPCAGSSIHTRHMYHTLYMLD